MYNLTRSLSRVMHVTMRLSLAWTMSCLVAVADTSHRTGTWQSLFDGKSLAGWQVTSFDRPGTAEVSNGELRIGAGRPMSGITWQGEFPTSNYELQLEARRVSGSDFFCGLTFPVGDEFCTFIVGGWGGGLVGLSCLNGQDASENQTTILDQFTDDRWYRIRLQVTDHEIKAWIDKKLYVSVERAEIQFSVRAEVEPSRPMGLATFRTLAAYRNIGIRRIDPPVGHPGTIYAELNISYAGTSHPRQTLDLFLPSTRKAERLPVIAYIHGGAWQAGDKRSGYELIQPFVETGHYAGVSIGYRLTNDATWPAQIHDCKAAIRWIRAHAGPFQLDPERIGVMGHSAGGHLAAMLGTSGNVAELEGDLGQSQAMSSRVHCVVDFFGPADLLTLGDAPSRIDHLAPGAPESRLLGGTILERQQAAYSASPTSFVSDDDPPFLLVHGTDDDIVPYQQSARLKQVLQSAGVPAVFVTIDGGGHGGFKGRALERCVADFFAKHLRAEETSVADMTIAPASSTEPR